jgi:hypothetical protein
MLYKVVKRYARGGDIPAAEFSDINDAKLFIRHKLVEDRALKVDVRYQLREGFDVLQEFSQQDVQAEGGSSSAGSPQRSSGQSFQPTPFNSAPRPTGIPHNWVKDDDKDKK